MPFYYIIYRILHKLKLGVILYPLLSKINSFLCDVKLPTIKKSEKILNKADSHNNYNSISNKDDFHIKGTDCIKYDLQIIIPVYNSEEYLKGCLNSVLYQHTQYKFHLIIIDDGSTDNTSRILKLYKRCPLIKIIRQKNLGRSSARNAGLKYVNNSNYVMFIDSDDKLAPNAIQNLLSNAYITNSDVTLGGYRIFNSHKIIKKIRYKMNRRMYLNSSDDINGYLWGKVFKSSLFNNVRFPEGYEFEDTILAFLIYPKCQIISSINKNVYFYRNNPNSITHTFKGSNVAIDSFLITQLLLKSLSERDMHINEYLYNTFLAQVKMNFIRNICSNINIQKSIFVLTNELFNKYFKGYRTNIRYYKPLEDSLIYNNYNNYVLSCLLIL